MPRRFNSILILTCILSALLTSCAPKPLPQEMGNPNWGVDVFWHGHSCFSLRDSLGRTVVIDPFDETVGYDRLNLRADALLVTHPHFDHNHKRAVKARLRDLDLMESTGTFSVASGLLVTGVDSFHDNEGGEIHGHNRLFVFEMEGLRFAHLGDLGQTRLSPLQRASLGRIDVLFIPVGGVVTLDAVQAKEIVEQIRPGLIFPMHYGNIRFYRLDPVEKFISLFSMDQIKRAGPEPVRVRLSDLTESPTVVVMKPSNENY